MKNRFNRTISLKNRTEVGSSEEPTSNRFFEECISVLPERHRQEPIPILNSSSSFKGVAGGIISNREKLDYIVQIYTWFIYLLGK